MVIVICKIDTQLQIPSPLFSKVFEMYQCETYTAICSQIT